MPKIVTSSELQKQIGQLMKLVGKSWMIVTSRGKAKVVMLPYFDDNDQAVNDYLEEYEIRMNASALKKRWEESVNSGDSDIAV